MELSPAVIISPSITSIQYKVERDKRYLPYIELGRWLCSDFQLNSRLIFTTDNLKPIQRRALNLVSLDSLGSWESIYVYFKTINLEKHELNHFEDNRNTILELIWSLTSEHEMARETKIQSFYYFISK